MDTLQNKRREKVVVDERGMMDLPFLVLTVLLTAIGLIMMFSASYARAYADEGNSTYYFARQAGFAAVGLVALLLITRLDYHMWRLLMLPMLGVSVILLLLVLLI